VDQEYDSWPSGLFRRRQHAGDQRRLLRWARRGPVRQL